MQEEVGERPWPLLDYLFYLQSASDIAYVPLLRNAMGTMTYRQTDAADREQWVRAAIPPRETRRLLTARGAAASLGVSERTIRRAIARGDLPAVKERGVYRLRPDVVGAYGRAIRQTSSDAVPWIVALPVWSEWQAPPDPLTPLIGRTTELRQVVALLADPAVRLVTLTGPGGIGKTRLALAVAADVEWTDEVVFVNLAPLQRADQVGAAIAQAFGLHEADDDALRRQLRSSLRGRRALLILDNCEHVLDAAPLIARIIAESPGLTVLATSRAPLRVLGEHEAPIPPLPRPTGSSVSDLSLADVERSDAVILFMARARATDPTFALTPENARTIADICRTLEGIPLALELAAARIKMLPPTALLDRLSPRLPMLTGGSRGMPPRHQTMRATIAWSYDLLTPDERMLFRRLSVFSGGFTLESAEALSMMEAGETARRRDSQSDDGGQRAKDGRGSFIPHLSLDTNAPPPITHQPTPMSTLDLLASLLEKNMVARDAGGGDAPRFSMLETIREYGQEHLEASGEAPMARNQHAAWFTRLVTDTEGRIPRPDRWWSLFDRERENIRSALEWCIVSGNGELGLQLATSLFGYWMLRGQITEGIGWLTQLRQSVTEWPSALTVRATMALGYLTWFAGDLGRAESLARDALQRSTDVGDPVVAATSYFLLGFVKEVQQDRPAAIAAFEQAYDAYRDLGAIEGQAAVNAHLGRVLIRSGSVQRGRALIQESVPILEGVSGAWGAATGLAELGLLAAESGDLATAADLLAQSLDHHMDLDDRLVVLPSLTAATLVLLQLGDAQVAAQLLGAAQRLYEVAGPSLWSIASPSYDKACNAAKISLGEDTLAYEIAVGREFSLEAALEVAVSALAEYRQAAFPSALTRFPALRLSRRSMEILHLLAERRTDREIAEQLFLSRRTIEWYVSDILARLEVRSRHEAVKRARELRLL